MVFSSITFLFYFLPISIIGYYALAFSRKVQNIWLLVVSLIFYAWGEPVFVFVMMGSVVFNWVSGLLIESTRKKENLSKVILFIACAGNILLLCAFKYTNFIVDNLYKLIGWERFMDVPKIALPIGISFFTFQAMSYVIDVYRQDAKVQKNLLDLGLYVTFFPQLVAGPIVRYNSIAEQILHRKTTFAMFAQGACRFTTGMIKKIIISNNMAVVTDMIYDLTLAGADTKQIPVMLAWTGATTYMIQLYYDFSGYSDMAIGLGKMFGFEFEENFNHPFISKSVREFMNRWHMSLGKWFSSYVYRPLGGSRVENDDFMVRNLLVVWILTGIWHGASWTYIWWGLGFFVFIVIEKVIGLEKWKGGRAGKHIYAMIAVTLLCVFFRAETMTQAFEMFKNMFGVNGNGFFSDTAVMYWKEYWGIYIIAIIFMMPVREFFIEKMKGKKIPMPLRILGGTSYVVILMGLMTFCVVTLAKGGYNPFIYFNF